jgi:hypothetical protein
VVVDKACQVAVIVGDFAPLQLGEVEERLVEGIDIFHILSPLFGVEDPAAHPELRRTRSNFTRENLKPSGVEDTSITAIRCASNKGPNIEQIRVVQTKSHKTASLTQNRRQFSQRNQCLRFVR